jgi:hypothetical protein
VIGSLDTEAVFSRYVVGSFDKYALISRIRDSNVFMALRRVVRLAITLGNSQNTVFFHQHYIHHLPSSSSGESEEAAVAFDSVLVSCLEIL